jgi:eukaryotic-like serine/threonine-protein kinase
MQLVCPQCQRVLEYSQEAPSFCAYCGNALVRTKVASAKKEDATAEYPSGTNTAVFAGPAKPAAGEQSFPETVGRYRLLHRLGEGGMGAVFEAEDSSSGRHVALKLIARAAIASPEAVERFRQEGRLASTIAHPRCVFVLAADEEAGQPYIVMELMPGSTLKDLVSRDGPLAPTKAVALILDVIEGLEEAHQRGVIHRDVKPSNCFLESDCRVKIGDFGLSKSVSGDGHLTKTGTFLGTPLFASPEQVRVEPLDQRTDVYSVAATLYFLLVGQAPFEGGNPTGVLARIVSEPTPSMRLRRREIPAALDRVVLRGLERSRERRWQNLEELRQALLPFVPGKLSFGGLGIRFGAYLLDQFILVPVNMIGTFFAIGVQFGIVNADTAVAGWLGAVLSTIPSLVYYATLDGFCGCSLGKWLLQLRVCGNEGKDAPGFARGALRAILFVGILNGPSIAVSVIWTTQDVLANAFLPLVSVLAFIVGIGLIMCTMRARNGYRGLHEVVSGTRVIQLPWRSKRKPYQQESGDSVPLAPDSIPDPVLATQLGPLTIRGALIWTDNEKVLLGVDQALGRQAWLWVRPAAAPALTKERQDLSRTTRLRWLAAGRAGTWQWDAFLAPPGCSLREAVTRFGKFTWTEARPVLEDLTDELIAGQDERRAPAPLSLDQVWLEPHGRVVLLDFVLKDSEPILVESEPFTDLDLLAGAITSRETFDWRRSRRFELNLLAEAAQWMLEGSPRQAGESGPVRAPLPEHASELLARLFGEPRPYRQAQDFQTDLLATQDRPTEVRRSRRAAHLALLGGVLFIGMGALLYPLFNSSKITYLRALEVLIQNVENTQASLAESKEDEPLRAQLRQKQTDLRTEYDDWHETTSWLDKQQLNLTKWLNPHRTQKENDLQTLRFGAQRDLAGDPRTEIEGASMTLMALLMVSIWPALWIAWAFLARGGFGYGLTGLRLLSADGSEATRRQCLARAVLFWLPIMALLMSSIGLDSWFWSLQDPQVGGVLAWLPRLSTALWLAGFLALAVYAGLALRSPTRSLHDRLVGTCLAPR